ncbi:bile acid:sodium symporter family protein [Gracilibacillus sp. Marseille-QA3620]
MLQSINRILNSIMAFFIPACLVIGFFLTDQLLWMSGLIPWVFAFMTFSGSLNSSFSSFKGIVKHPGPILITLVSLHIIMPLFAYGVGQLFYPDDQYTVTGIVLAMTIPAGITSFVWVVIYHGNRTLTLAIILISSLLSPFIVPFNLAVLVGESVHIDSLQIMKGLFWMVVFPSLAGMLFNSFTKKEVILRLDEILTPITKFGLGFVVMLNGAVIAPYIKETISGRLLLVGITVFGIALSGYVLSYVVAKITGQNKESIVSMTFSGGMRNISAGAVLATTYFPPSAAVPVVLGMLFQQLSATLFGKILNKRLHLLGE